MGKSAQVQVLTGTKTKRRERRKSEKRRLRKSREDTKRKASVTIVLTTSPRRGSGTIVAQRMNNIEQTASVGGDRVLVPSLTRIQVQGMSIAVQGRDWTRHVTAVHTGTPRQNGMQPRTVELVGSHIQATTGITQDTAKVKQIKNTLLSQEGEKDVIQTPRMKKTGNTSIAGTEN